MAFSVPNFFSCKFLLLIFSRTVNFGIVLCNNMFKKLTAILIR